MQELLKLLKVKFSELEDSYEEYLESEYASGAPSHWNSEDRCYEGPDFEKWCNANCLKFFDWVRSESEYDQVEEVLIVVNQLCKEGKTL